MRVLTCDPDTEINGEALQGLINNLQSDEIAPYLRKYGLDDVRPEGWYSLQDFQALLNELESSANSSPNFVAIGMAVADVAPMPPGLDNPTLDMMLEGWDEHYQLSHRYGNIGHKIAEKIEAKHYRMVLDGCVYPDDLEYGVLYGFAKRFLPRALPFLVWYDKDVKRLDEGGRQTVIHVRWE